LARSVGPPSAQCTRWWASVQAPGRSQPGKAHPSPSRRASARRWDAVNNLRARPTSSGWPSPSSTTGRVAGYPSGGARGHRVPGWQQRRAQPGAQVGLADGDHHRVGLAAVGVGQPGQEAPAQLAQGIGLPLAAGARVRAVLVRGTRLREWFQRRLQQGGGLRVQPAGDPQPAGAVWAQGQVPAVRPGLLPCQRLAEQPVGLLRGDDLEDVPAQLGELGRVKHRCLLDQVRLGLPPGSGVHTGGQGLHRAHDDPGLLLAHPPRRQRGRRPRELAVQRLGQPHRPPPDDPVGARVGPQPRHGVRRPCCLGGPGMLGGRHQARPQPGQPGLHGDHRGQQLTGLCGSQPVQRAVGHGVQRGGDGRGRVGDRVHPARRAAPSAPVHANKRTTRHRQNSSPGILAPQRFHSATTLTAGDTDGGRDRCTHRGFPASDAGVADNCWPAPRGPP